MKEELIKKRKMYGELGDSHKDSAAKLLKSVYMLIVEELARQSTEKEIMVDHSPHRSFRRY